MQKKFPAFILAVFVAFSLPFMFGHMAAYAADENGPGAEFGEGADPGEGDGEGDGEGYTDGTEDPEDPEDPEGPDGLDDPEGEDPAAEDPEDETEDRDETYSSFDLTIVKGEIYYLPLEGKGVLSFEDVQITIVYDPDVLQLTCGAAHLPGRHIKAGPAGGGLTILSYAPGEIVFAFDKAIPPGKEWSGLITLLMFEGLEDADTCVNISRTGFGESPGEEQGEDPSEDLEESDEEYENIG